MRFIPKFRLQRNYRMSYRIINYNPDGDGITVLYLDGELVTFGDYYHDKIDNYLEGYFDALELDQPNHESIKYSDDYNMNLTADYAFDTIEELEQWIEATEGVSLDEG